MANKDKDKNKPTSFGDLLHDVAKLRRQIEDRVGLYGKELLIVEIRAFFDRHPQVDGIRWSQFTPYFNDGEPCYFSVNEPLLLITDLTEEEQQACDDEFWLGSWNYINSRRELFEDIPNVFDEDTLRELFGDHAQVTIHRDGRVEVTECDHD